MEIYIIQNTQSEDLNTTWISEYFELMDTSTLCDFVAH